MELNEYQHAALSTAVFDEEYAILYPALKLAGEAGEVAEKVGKVLRDRDGVFSEDVLEDLAKEVGDVLWYVAAFSEGIGKTLEEVADANLEKLASRKQRGVINGSGDNR